MHRKHYTVFVFLAIVLMFSGSVFAQDPGERDTITMGIVNVDAGDHFSVPIRMYNDETVEAVSLGFWWRDDDIELDSVSWIGSNASHIATKPVDIDNDSGSVLIGVIKIFESPIQPGDSLLATLWFTANPGAVDQIIPIDSGFVPPAGPFKFNIGSGGESFPPEYIEGSVIIGNPQPPPVFILSDNEFNFQADEGGSDPTPQILQITNGGGQTLDWTATWNSTWLNVNPSSGTAPSSVSIEPSVTGLSAGTYVDTITLTDPDATNSPQYVEVNFEVVIPPPIIELVPDDFQFLAQEDSTNPVSQSMQINDIGAGTLSWTASNSESWLTLSAYSGGPGDVIDLNVDITGMSFGVYYDQIVVSDPNASNSPQIATVELTIVSGFPIIELDPDSFYVAASGSQEPYDREMLITNAGGDWLHYTITSAQGTMFFTPDEDSVISGETAPITIVFNTASLGFGLNYDTIQVSSPTAQNSPQIIPVTIWKMESPPILQVNPDVVTFDVYECYNYPNPPTRLISVQNTGAEHLDWTAYWDASWLILTPTSAENSATIFATVDVTGLAVGTYVDTVIVVAGLSITPPETVEVTLNVAEQTVPPEILVTQTHYEFLFKNLQVGTNEQPLTILNTSSGCMSWDVIENTTWLDVQPDAGEVPDQAWVGVNGFGLPLGKTSTTFTVESAEATNSPVEVTVDLYIWTFGDVNCDGIADIDDVVYDLDYIFNEGPEPCPAVWVGDVDCSHTVDIDDVTYLLAYIFQAGPPPCDWNPLPPPAPAVHTFQDVAVK